MANMLAVKAIKEPDYQKYVTENPQKMTPVSNDEWFAMVSNDNVVQTDLTKRNYAATKRVFGTTSIWKIH